MGQKNTPHRIGAGYVGVWAWPLRVHLLQGGVNVCLTPTVVSLHFSAQFAETVECFVTVCLWHFQGKQVFTLANFARRERVDFWLALGLFRFHFCLELGAFFVVHNGRELLAFFGRCALQVGTAQVFCEIVKTCTRLPSILCGHLAGLALPFELLNLLGRCVVLNNGLAVRYHWLKTCGLISKFIGK